jgi:phenylalanyl-tRNA synthetase alpha chain
MTLLNEALAAIESAASSAALEELRVSWLGKKGRVTEELKTLGALDPDARKAKGAELNEIKNKITEALDSKKDSLGNAELNARLASETIDITLPPTPTPVGKIHPVTQVIEEIRTIFAELGFSVAEGPDIEDAEHNFDALNIPESHPARQMHDTFYLKSSEPVGEPAMSRAPGASQQASTGAKEGMLLRTHTSPVQIRTMRAGKPPFRFIAPGSTYRCDSDLTHTPMFHQVEGFVIDKGIHMGHLKGCIIEFLKTFFELDSVPTRFRPSFFPFTEPSAEVDIGCKRSRDELKIGEGDDWLEVLGCGMIHPNVLKNCGIDPNEWQGFAFGMGVERLAMLKYGIPDLRTFFESDVRWLQHYGFAA